MKTKKQDLIDNPKELSSETHLLECFFSGHLNKFCLRLNAKLFTFKTWNGYVNRRDQFIGKYKLTEKLD
jgi:hypothetical protein